MRLRDRWVKLWFIPMKQESFDPGLTTQFSGELRRAINPDGTFNVRRKGLRLRDTNLYLMLIDTTWPRFLERRAGIFLGDQYVVCRDLSAHRHGSPARRGAGDGRLPERVLLQRPTLTTVGYGNVFPSGTLANALAALEAATGLMVFALATGLLYGRFSRPSAQDFVQPAGADGALSRWDQPAIPHHQRPQQRLDGSGGAGSSHDGGSEPTGSSSAPSSICRWRRRKVYFFPLTWTVVHPIDAASPLSGKTAEDLKGRRRSC